jgi:hypothetical protein
VTTATIFTFDRGKYKSTAGNEPRVGEPWIYVWIDPASKRALYVGETGHSQRYDLRYRLRCSIGELASSTLRQVKRNANRTGFDVLAGELKTYAYPLSQNAADRKGRRAVESWLHWLITVERRVHHPQYFGFAYHVPEVCYKAEAVSLCGLLAHELGW